MRKIACLGLSHHRTPVELRERLCTSLETIQTVIAAENGNGEGPFASIRELALLHTCNRVELYGLVEACETGSRHVLTAAICRATGLSPIDLREYVYYHAGIEAVRHLCRVACGLDSQVLGEQQVLGQVTDCQDKAEGAGLLGPSLRLAFRTAVRAGRRARTETDINRSPVSVSSVAIGNAQALLGDLTHREVLVVGAGEMGVLTLKALRARSIERVSVTNRTVERAQHVAQAHGYEGYAFDRLPELLTRADVAVVATSAKEPVVTASLMRDVMALRSGREIVLIDISVPRNVASDVGDVPDVRLFDTDDLHDTVDRARMAREEEIPRVESIIDVELESFRHSIQERMVAPLITDLRRKAEAIRQQELDRTLHHLGDVDEATWQHIQHLSQALVNKLLHEPTTRIRSEAGNGHTDELVSTVRTLFGLSEEKSLQS